MFSFSRIQTPHIRLSLFWKVMLIFWLTLFLTLIANTFITRQISRIEWQSSQLSKQLKHMAEDAVAVYETSGKQGLQRWYQLRYQQQKIRLLLVDQNDRPIGHPIPLKHKTKPEKEHHPFFMRYVFIPNRMMHPHIPVKGLFGDRYVLRALPSPFLWKRHPNPTWYVSFRLLVTLVIVGLSSFWLTRQIAKPVRQLQAASLQMAEGNLSARVPETTTQRKDELGELGQTFNHMAEKVSGMLDQQKQLLRDISHEIKTPLTRQRLAISLAKEMPDDRLLLEKIENQNIKLARLIDDLLILNRLDNQGQMKNQNSVVNIPNILKATIEDAEIEATSRHIRLDFILANNIPPLSDINVIGNLDLLIRAIENLLGNAIKYGPESSTIRLCLDIKENKVLISIIDEGNGIPQSHWSKIFTPFYRIDDARAEQTGGHGLGLTIVHKIITEHQGQIYFEKLSDNAFGVRVLLPLATDSYHV
jgi:signal transduction histidine kinase